jgi:hypothetical protein
MKCSKSLWSFLSWRKLYIDAALVAGHPFVDAAGVSIKGWKRSNAPPPADDGDLDFRLVSPRQYPKAYSTITYLSPDYSLLDNHIVIYSVRCGSEMLSIMK